jgi:hypothetical protein
MGLWASAFNLVSLFYAAIALLTLFRLVRRRREAFDDRFSATDRGLIAAVAFYLLTPPAVALHELGHAVAIWLLGGRVLDFHFLFYWGFVVHQSLGPYADLAVALAGNLVTIGLGGRAAWWVLHHPRNAATNFLWRKFAEIQLSLALVFYPLLCLVGFGGDWQTIYRLETAPVSAPLLALHLVVLAKLWQASRGPLGARWRLLGSPLWDEVRRAKTELQTDQKDISALLRLGWCYLSAGLCAEAQAPLSEAVKLRPELPAAHALLGQALLHEEGSAGESELNQALSSADLDPMLAATSHLALARRLLGEGQCARALPHAMAALDGLPVEPAAAQLLWEAADGACCPRKVLAALERASDKGNATARRALEALEHIPA